MLHLIQLPLKLCGKSKLLCWSFSRMVSLILSYTAEQIPFNGASQWLHVFVYIVCTCVCVNVLCANTECTVNRTWPHEDWGMQDQRLGKRSDSADIINHSNEGFRDNILGIEGYEYQNNNIFHSITSIRAWQISNIINAWILRHMNMKTVP